MRSASLLARNATLMLALILAFQGIVSLQRINEPIVDGRKHWYWDNALFLLKARHSNYTPPDSSIAYENEALKFFGTASYDVTLDGEITGLRFYSHHPVLTPTLFRLYTLAFGYENWVPRSFMLVFSLMTTVVLFLFLRSFVKMDWICGLLALWYVFLPLNFMYMDQWKYEVVANFLLLLTLLLLCRLGEAKTRIHRYVFLFSLFLLLHTEWHVYFALPCILLYLFMKRKEPGFDRVYLQATLVSVVSIALNFWILYHLGLQGEEMGTLAAFRMGGGMEGVSTGEWLSRQSSFLETNFGTGNLVFFLAAMVYVFLKRKEPLNHMVLSSLIVTFSTICWIGIFKNLSLIHHYVQWSFGLAVVLLVGGLVAEVPGSFFRTRDGRRTALAIAVSILFFTGLGAFEFQEEIRKGTFGTEEDLEAISGTPGRLLIFSDGRSGPVGWWLSPVVELAQDPIFQGRKLGGKVKRIEEASEVDPRRDVLVILNSKRAWTSFRQYCHGRLGVTEFRLVRKSPSFSFIAFGSG